MPPHKGVASPRNRDGSHPLKLRDAPAPLSLPIAPKRSPLQAISQPIGETYINRSYVVPAQNKPQQHLSSEWRQAQSTGCCETFTRALRYLSDRGRATGAVKTLLNLGQVMLYFQL